MTLKVFKSGLVRTASKVSVKVGGVVKEVDTIRIMKTINNAKGLRNVYAKTVPPVNPPPTPVPTPPPPAPLAVACQPTAATAYRDSTAGPGPATTDPVKAVVTGGTAPFTYAWSMVSWSTTNPSTIVAPTAQQTSFTHNVDKNETVTSRAKVTVKDANNNLATAYVDLTFAWRKTYYGGGGGISDE